MIQNTVLRARLPGAAPPILICNDAHRFLEVTYASGEKETLYFKDFVSGAMIESVCTRAKKTAVKRMITTGVRGITAADLAEAVKAEFRENEDLPNTTNPDDWAKIAGRRGERIVHVRAIGHRRNVYDLAGRLVATLFSGRAEAGEHALSWSGRSDQGVPVEAGLYLVRLVTPAGERRAKFVVLR